MNKVLVTFKNIPQFMLRDTGDNIIMLHGKPVLHDEFTVEMDEDWGDNIMKKEAIHILRKTAVFVYGFVQTEALASRSMMCILENIIITRHLKAQPKESIFDGLTDTERRIIEEYRASQRRAERDVLYKNIFGMQNPHKMPISSLIREDLPMRIVLITPDKCPSHSFGYTAREGRLLDPEEQEGGVYERD